MKKFIKALTASAAALELLLAVILGTADYFTPNSFTITDGSRLEWLSGVVSVVADHEGEVAASASTEFPKVYEGKLMFYNLIPIKTVSIHVVDDTCVVPCGMPFGIRLFTNGVMIVGLADIQTDTGIENPASLAGLKVGDIITEIQGKPVTTNEEVAEAVENSEGKSLKMVVRREDSKQSILLHPVLSESDGLYKAGLWVRSSTAGIGTLTFYDPSVKSFAGLGHGICDSDTGELMPLLSGDIVPVTISGITKGKQGKPGELRGYFSDDTAMGNLTANDVSGVFGTMDHTPDGTALKVAMKQEVKTGPVKILTTIDGGTPQCYNAVIEKIDYRDNVQSKNMVIRIIDKKLLIQTGGIVQGMSGSPILQNNKLVGAVTHVFVNDPSRGYGIFAENMLAASQAVNSNQNAKVS